MTVGIVTANSRAVRIADLAVAVEVLRDRRGEPVPLGLVPNAMQVDPGRIRQAIEATGDVLMVARNEPLLTAATSVQRALEERQAGWVRKLDADPCQLCRWWWRDGRVWPADHPMPRHTGCACVQQPVFS